MNEMGGTTPPKSYSVASEVKALLGLPKRASVWAAYQGLVARIALLQENNSLTYTKIHV